MKQLWSEIFAKYKYVLKYLRNANVKIEKVKMCVWKTKCDQSERNFVDQFFTNLMRKYVSNYVQYYLLSAV